MPQYLAAAIGISLSAFGVRKYLCLLNTNHKISIAILGIGCASLCFCYCERYTSNKEELKDVGDKEIEVLFFPDQVTNEIDMIAETRELRAIMYNEVLCELDKEDETGLQRLLHHINTATKSIDLCLFLVTSEPLCDCIIEKINQGVKVRAIVDGTTYESPDSKASKFQTNGAIVISSWCQTNYFKDSFTLAELGLTNGDLLMHHKFAVIDNSILITGSFNWTFSAAMKNKENIIITSSKYLVNPFIKEFQKIWEQCNPK